MQKRIIIDNPSNLPLISIHDIHTFQGNLKLDPTEAALEKLMRSILDHHISDIA